MVESPLITNQQRENLFELQHTLIDLKSTQKNKHPKHPQRYRPQIPTKQKTPRSTQQQHLVMTLYIYKLLKKNIK